MTQPHPLNNVIWSALTSRQASLAIGEETALRFPADIAPFAAMPSISPDGFDALTRMTQPGERVAFFTPEKFVPPSHFVIERDEPLDQMVGLAVQKPVNMDDVITLGADDVPDMLALVALTQPGPFAARTYRMGKYLGIRIDGQLVAMAGERMNLDGYTEISAVCTHPDFRGRGFPARLVMAVSNGIVGRGDTPFLHVLPDNLAASSLYRKLGFEVRRTAQLTVLVRNPT